MKKLTSMALALIMLLTTLSMGFSAFASNSITYPDVLSFGEAVDVLLEYDSKDEAHYGWASFTPETTGTYVFDMENTYGDDVYMFFTTTYPSLGSALGDKDELEADGYVFYDYLDRDVEGDVYTLQGGVTYYILFETWSEITKNITVPVTVNSHTHTYTKYTYKADFDYDGEINTECSTCGYIKATTKIYKAKTPTLSTKTYTYDGKVKTPGVTVKDTKGKALVKNTDYTVTYPSGRKAVGKYDVTVKLKGKYEGSKKVAFTIKPKGTSISKLTATKKGFKATWKKQSTQTSGYQIQIATNSGFTKGVKNYYVSKNSTTSKSISKLTAKKKYYVRIRTYKNCKYRGNTVKVYSSWSKSKTVTTKK